MTDIDNTIARYSMLNDSEQLYAVKYMTYMPMEEVLKQGIEQQKDFFSFTTQYIELRTKEAEKTLQGNSHYATSHI